MVKVVFKSIYDLFLSVCPDVFLDYTKCYFQIYKKTQIHLYKTLYICQSLYCRYNNNTDSNY